MNRRRLLRGFIGSATALAIAPGWLRAEVAYRSDSAGFALALEERPWLAGFSNVGSDALGPGVALLEGRLPLDLAGTLYRNGPARFDRAGFRYQHLFDGDGMVQAWQIGHGAVEHRARMVATTKFVGEQRAGRFLLPAGGTTVPNAQTIRNNDDMNTANTAVIRFNGRLFALWEGGSAIELQPDTLHTIGPVTWREELVAAPFSAHPLRDRDGSLWNFGNLNLIQASGLLIWHIGSDGNPIRTAMLATDPNSYIHGFAMTDRHLIFMLMPYRLREDDSLAFFESLQFQSDQPCRVAVVPKDALDAPRWFELPFGAVYHFADACERKREIVVQAVRHNDIDEMRSPLAAVMRGERGPDLADTEFVELRLNLGNGRARWQGSGMRELEFPTFDPRFGGARMATVYAPCSVGPSTAPYFNAIAAIDAARGRRELYRYGDDVMAEEHVFVPRPGSREPGQGWLLGTLLDHRRARSGMAVLDAEHVADGPLAQAWLPYAMPLGFHGSFDPNS